MTHLYSIWPVQVHHLSPNDSRIQHFMTWFTLIHTDDRWMIHTDTGEKQCKSAFSTIKGKGTIYPTKNTEIP